ncbi:hypothetical protein ACQ86N_03390 [Puia sp. P3]|uniref:hypothetical protein n=1 Tax=Puia sp. P3 TaxID=3423952 RepID=UPI003D677973
MLPLPRPFMSSGIEAAPTPPGGNSLKIGGPVNIHMAPYRMGGPYVSVYFYFTANWWR